MANKVAAAAKKLPCKESIPVLFAGGISRQHQILFPMIEKYMDDTRCHLFHLEQEPVEGAILRAQKLFYEKGDCQ